MVALPARINDERRMRENPQDRAFAAVGLPRGLCLGSKSAYRASRGRHFFVPNAYVFCQRLGLVWWGDLDILKHQPQLERVARALRSRLYVLPECRAVRDANNILFSEVEHRAIWHTGGRVRPDQRLIRASGLEPKELKMLLGVSGQRLNRPQHPYVALQINEKLRGLENFFGPLTRHYGFRKWGDWLRAPHPRLKGRSPFEILHAGGQIIPSEIFSEIYSDHKILRKYWQAVLCGICASLLTEVHTRWPIVERRKSSLSR